MYFLLDGTNQKKVNPISHTIILMIGIIFALPVLAFIGWRFGGSDTLALIVVSGGFTAIMDFISSFVAKNYEYPGQYADSIIYVLK